MQFFLCLLAAAFSVDAGVSGVVQTSEGAAVPNARVFMEPGIAGTLIETRADADGRFHFEQIPMGPVGIFAHATGLAFGGAHLNVSMGEHPAPLKITLRKSGDVSGTVKNSDGDKLEEVRITRLALLDDKVGIPLTKLRALGYPEVVSDKRGAFSVPNLPIGGAVALKLGHPDYAQEGVESVQVGGKADVTLYRGVLVDGTVSQSESNVSISQAAVLIRNAQPPFDTALVQSDGYGTFTLRLKPGVYLAQAVSVGQSSPGWEELVISGESKIVKCRLNLVGTGVISGKLLDAVSGNAVEGARITLDTNGNLAAVERTGPSGEFRFIAGRGMNVVTYAATPGYLPPEVKVHSLELKAGESISLPDVWLAPTPPYNLTVVDAELRPVSNARVQILRPRQFGWQSANGEGKLQLQFRNLGGEGEVIGLAEDPEGKGAALFLLQRDTAVDAKVQLLPLSSLRGKVEGDRGKALPGVTVGAILPDEDVATSLLLWRVLTNQDGEFYWPMLVPGFPQLCVARTASGAVSSAQLVQGNADASGELKLETLTLKGGDAGTSIAGDKLTWESGGPLCGGALTQEQKQWRKAVFYVSESQFKFMLETLEKDAPKLHAMKWAVLLVLETEGATCESNSLPVYRGKAPSTAKTFLLDENDTVLMETFDLPPLSLLGALSKL